MSAPTLLTVLSQVGELIMTTGDCALMRMTSKTFRDSLRRRTEDEEGYVDGKGLSVSASLARWALEHEVANFGQLWCVPTPTSWAW